MFNGNSDGFTMPVVPAYGNGGNNGLFGGEGIWGLLVILLLFSGFGGYGMGGGYGSMGGMIYPWMNQAEITQDGFRDQMMNGNVNSIRDGIGNIQLGMANGFSQAEIAANARQLADLNRSFDAQTATTQGLTALQSQLAQCCCDNRLATCQTQNVVQNEGNSTRFADANNTRDIITNATANTQAILDKLCQLELDGVKREVSAKNDRIAELQTQLNMATLRESQTAQNAFIANGLNAEVDQLYNRLKNCPVPSQPVYGSTPIFTCNSQNPIGCGCGCGGSF